MATAVFRVAVSGRFGEMSERMRAHLESNAADHDPVRAEFGPEPNLTYRKSLDVLSVRLEVRVDDADPDPAGAAEAAAVTEAAEFLRVLGIGHGDLRARVSSMGDASAWRGDAIGDSPRTQRSSRSSGEDSGE